MQEFLAKYMPIDASAHGPELDRLTAMVHWLMLILFVGWGLFFIVSLVKFRAGKAPRANYHGVRSHLSSYVEVSVLLIEIVLLVGFSIPAWRRWVQPPGKADNPLEIRVVAEQFAWNVHYPGPDGKFSRADVNLISGSNPLGLDPTDPAGKDDITTLNELHLEVNRPVLVHLSSKDVIHSFGLPTMRVKQDAIPGMNIPIHFTPVKTNSEEQRWEIACAQLCGLGHFRMRGMINVHSKGDFQAWLTSKAPAPTAVASATPPG